MAGSTTSPRRRARKSTRVTQELQAARERNAAQLREEREREARVVGALELYFGLTDDIAAVAGQCERRIEPHARAIERLRTERDAAVAGFEVEQALAALVIKDANRTVHQVGELLGISKDAATRLLAAARDAAATPDADTTDQPDTDDAQVEQPGPADAISTPSWDPAGPAGTGAPVENPQIQGAVGDDEPTYPATLGATGL